MYGDITVITSILHTGKHQELGLESMYQPPRGSVSELELVHYPQSGLHSLLHNLNGLLDISYCLVLNPLVLPYEIMTTWTYNEGSMNYIFGFQIMLKLIMNNFNP